MNQRNKLLIALALILSLAFLGISAINYMITRTSVHSEIIQNDLPLTMNNIYSDLSAEMNRPIVVASSMAADTFLKDWVMEGEQDIVKIQKYLFEIKEKYGYFSTFFISAYSFNYYHFKGIHKQINPANDHDVWYYKFIASEKEYELDVDTDEASGNILTIFVNHRVEDDEGRLLGVTGVGLKVDSIARLVEEYKEKYDRNVFLTNKEGVIQVHQDISRIEKVNIRELGGLQAHSTRILTAGEQPEHVEYLRGDEQILLNVRYIPTLDWLLFVEQSETRSLVTARKNFLRTVGLGFLSSVLVISLTLITINRYQKQLENLATSDALTGAGNRRRLEEEFSKAVYITTRSKQPFSLILLDLDKFKEINDLQGHLYGDKVLQTVSNVVLKIIRPTDVLARWGGDEFAILTASNLQDGLVMAERIRESVDSTDWTSLLHQNRNERMKVTISLGVAQYRVGDTLDAVLSRADQSLYRSKGQGGNKVEQEIVN